MHRPHSTLCFDSSPRYEVAIGAGVHPPPMLCWGPSACCERCAQLQLLLHRASASSAPSTALCAVRVQCNLALRVCVTVRAHGHVRSLIARSVRTIAQRAHSHTAAPPAGPSALASVLSTLDCPAPRDEHRCSCSPRPRRPCRHGVRSCISFNLCCDCCCTRICVCLCSSLCPCLGCPSFLQALCFCRRRWHPKADAAAEAGLRIRLPALPLELLVAEPPAHHRIQASVADRGCAPAPLHRGGLRKRG